MDLRTTICMSAVGRTEYETFVQIRLFVRSSISLVATSFSSKKFYIVELCFRFASTVAKRLESLGALTHGDRRASNNKDLSQFNIDNKYGKAALDKVLKVILSKEEPLVSIPNYNGDFVSEAANALVGVGLITGKLEKTYDRDPNSLTKFLNRLLGMPVDLQNKLFE